ncbi:hypothetical protein OPT61_g35 [Boeremia exigua]|uniref:Uncharacterized protein n=1 Tax=Boeremia exigua TaxID=749465 RepID=A0ACC2IVQ5_9PLEO|nr:hypothetical protein OPT61_g35 [Boeremia exigua]
MDQEITSKKLQSNIENAEVRSVWGDMHMHREALMRDEHVAFLYKNGIVDAAMAVELMKPVDKDRNYTEEYLQTHPDYTGVQPEMTALSTADRHQKQRDREMEKIVKNYEAGRIDEHGNSIANDDTKSDSDDSELTDLAELESHLDYVDEATERLENAPQVPLAYHHNPSSLSATRAASRSPPRSLYAPKTASARESPDRKRKCRVDPIQPLSGGEDYSQYKYYQLLAVCRERQIYSSGDTQEVRNCLIQDDINIQQGLPRDIARWKGHIRKDFKNGVPHALKRDSGEQ